jgi:16S rRNA (guanine(1405)-N(7))-methyltransferase
MNIDEKFLQEMVAAVLDSKKYRYVGVNPATIEDLIRTEALHNPSHKAILKSVKRKLHNIVAPYLGEPDYAALTDKLTHIHETSLDSAVLRAFCLDVLSQHASTAERIPIMAAFYKQLFRETGEPRTILDLACGLHPLAFPWMGLPRTVTYHAYDIVQPRVDFINLFFNKIGLAPLAENRDILVDPPSFDADLAIFFKEAHRFEKRQPGCNRAFWENLNVKTLAISLPCQNLTGTHSLLEVHRNLVAANLAKNHLVHEISCGNEIIFLVERPGANKHG